MPELQRLFVGLNVSAHLRATLERIEENLARESVVTEDLVREKQALWGLAYEVLNWVETRRVAAAVLANSQTFSPEEGTFSTLSLASGASLVEMAASAAGLTEPLEGTIRVRGAVMLSAARSCWCRTAR